MAENTEKKYIDHITLPPESEDSAERVYQIADSDWRKSAARKIKTAHILKWNKNIGGNLIFEEEKGVANGVAPLNSKRKINNEYLSILDNENIINEEFLPSRVKEILIPEEGGKSALTGSIVFSAGDGITIKKENDIITFSTTSESSEGSSSTSNINNLIDGQYVEGALRGVGTAENAQPPAEGDPPVIDQYYMGEFATALGIGTKANSDASLTIGKYNIQDNNKEYAFIIGNGTNEEENGITQSNAFTVDWDGNVTISGTPSENNHVVTKTYVDNATSNIKILSAGLADPSYGNWKLPWINFTDPNTGVIYNLSINQNQNQRFTFNFNAKQAGSNSWITLANMTLN